MMVTGLESLKQSEIEKKQQLTLADDQAAAVAVAVAVVETLVSAAAGGDY